MRDALRRCQTFHTFAPRLERLRPDVIPLRSRKAAKSSEDKQGRHFVDNCRVRVKVIFCQILEIGSSGSLACMYNPL